MPCSASHRVHLPGAMVVFTAAMLTILLEFREVMESAEPQLNPYLRKGGGIKPVGGGEEVDHETLNFSMIRGARVWM